MSALPPHHQFRHARSLQDGTHDTSGIDLVPQHLMPQSDAVAVPDHGSLEDWHATHPCRRQRDSSGTEVYPHALRIVLIGTLSVVCWAMVVALWDVAAHALG